MKIQLILCVFWVIGILKTTAQTNSNTKNEISPISIVPQPTKLIPVTGSFTITNRMSIIVPNANSGIRRVAQQFADRIKIDGTNPVFNFKNPSGTPWQIDPLNSRWQAQAGVRYSF